MQAPIPPLTLTDRWRLYRARTFADLTGLARTNLTRHMYSTALDPDDRTRVEALIALTHHGVLPLDSQCGSEIVEHGVPGRRRPAFWFIADEITKNWVENALYHADIKYGITVLEAHGPDSLDQHPSPGLPVIKFDDCGVRTLGAQLTADQLHDRFPVRAGLAGELRRRWQVLVHLPTGDGADMFAALLAAADNAYDAVQISRS